MASSSISYEQIEATLLSRFEGKFHKLSDIPDPALLKDGLKAAQRIAGAIKGGENITVVGDYDVDGVTSTAIMTDFFRLINYPLTTIIPNRFSDGYGISPNVMQRINNAQLIITVDNGINANAAADICKQRGIDLIITDHHTPSPVLPDAFAIVDPKLSDCPYPFKEICGAQVAWLVLALVKKELNADVNMSSFLDLLSVAIIADVMPLISINRAMVQSGLKKIAQAYRPAMIALCSYLNKELITAEDIGFQIAPRINSAGRMDDASHALAFLTANDPQVAFEALEKLDRLNIYRKDVEANATQEAMDMVNPDDTIIVVAHKNWHEGVVGIVASRLVDKFGKPALVLAISDGIAKGSARSIGDVNLHELLVLSDTHLQKYGGHKMAAGLSLQEKDLQAFKDEINSHGSKLDASLFIPKDQIMGELYSKDIDFKLFSMIENFEPFGEGNLRPKFLMKDVKANFVKRMGKDKMTLGFSVESPFEQYGLKAVAFRNNDDLQNGQKLSFSYTLNKNEFRDKVNLQLMLDKLYLD